MFDRRTFQKAEVGKVATYTSATRQRLDDVQGVLDVHAISSADGRCVSCAVEGPCGPRRDALHVLASWHQLPRRRPGATRPEFVGARRVRHG
jgi:hypothetical protein